MKEIKKKIPRALIAVFGAGVMAIPHAHAQQAQKVEKIEVTGSNIKRVEAETVAPVAVITRTSSSKAKASPPPWRRSSG